MPLYVLIVDTYEPPRRTPILRHEFFGETPAQAQAFYRAHLASDQFLRECNSGLFRGKLRCRNAAQPIKRLR